MYRQNNNRYRRNFSRSNRPIRSYDPSNLVNYSVQTSTEEKPYVAVNSFAGFNISETLKRNIAARGYIVPTPIQDQVIPLILEGEDVIGIANTGTGKTAAFLIPLLDEVGKNRNKNILIIIPTRELADQIKNEFIEFARGTNIYCALAIGGTNIHRQMSDLRRNPNFVIGTPGRLKDLIEQRILNLSVFDTIVLDEVDQMVDIGFLASIKYFISLLAAKRQSLFFSATVDGKVKQLLNRFVKNPVTISVKKQDILKNIRHDVIRVSDKIKKIEQLHDLLVKKEFEKVLIFGRTKWGMQRLSDELVDRGFNADVIHGNKRQSQRLRILDRFKRNEIRILLATDVASRGLDIDNVTHVINYDPPESYEVYIHRIGRTGRADKTGTALTFV
ncbi:hypothetical protein A2954_01715 [Candidatus Roizmanbacteria bacterium RIFCSPLOWO2_01_FULL_37_12]|uniref:RNA helicase n=1 Tax=Candidatus Roizmanbacteria bacterium RIFCSPLOWO2_01_FULL_37_12 TaxID=1802056 RepID=A0A1F7I9C5_9BACT|nr:MAG: hypothetical protein A2768_01015 [Candidatus Roizmanbacteria bacterium RIFCSPHIGHO2_01_FULL_37_16]OGK23104.1 MAG: hypothetical protein A3D76_05860 [Candidatus Roizmanbacteria bacterium RIFCSPHIGHO2_02_FULL_37_9b]OGK39965.1 MAG: hypothetical protein A2954_01715 [Candidatus Roizmanbacteria bacterium RIFCSPLOWO2_01_FULL_37_12]